MKEFLHNQRYLETLLKLKYHLEDSFECYDFVAQDLKAEGEVDTAVGQLFALNQDKAAQAFLRQVSLIKDIDKIVKQKITQVEATNTTPYGWNVAKNLEPEHGIFSEQDKANTKALREAEALVQRDNREFNTRKNTKRRGGTRWTPAQNSRINS